MNYTSEILNPDNLTYNQSLITNTVIDNNVTTFLTLSALNTTAKNTNISLGSDHETDSPGENEEEEDHDHEHEELTFFDKFLQLIGVSLMMFIASYLAGLVPLWLNLSKQKIQHCSALGAGLLLGVSVAVIIPEGIHAIYNVKQVMPEMNEGPLISISILRRKH